MTSTLALKKSDFETETGDWLGIGRGEAGGDLAWSDRDTSRLKMIVASALRRFYSAHPWSFLRDTKSFTIPEGQTTLKLPADFCGVDGGSRICVTQTSTGQAVADNVPFCGVGKVTLAHGLATVAIGIPKLIAQRPIKTVAVGQMQRSELFVYPIPDQDYDLTFEYLLAPEYLVDISTPYALGDLNDHQTILDLCRAEAEIARDNQIGPQNAKAEDSLKKSIRRDRMKRPTNLGYNRDRSDQHGGWWDRWNGRGWNSTGITVDGILYD